MLLHDKIKTLTNDQLFQLIKEVSQLTVADDALIRQVIKDTEHDTTAPMLAFIAVHGTLSFVLADRLAIAVERIKSLEGTFDRTASDL